MSETYEEEYQGYTIIVEPSPDRWNPAYQWSICRDEIEYNCAISFTLKSAIEDAQSAINELRASPKRTLIDSKKNSTT
ncbi:MAG: hypothetical protein LAT53_11955 [Idiomarina sp.]|nr:hypothetical protein [Idiomarina sp.]